MRYMRYGMRRVRCDVCCIGFGNAYMRYIMRRITRSDAYIRDYVLCMRVYRVLCAVYMMWWRI